MQLVNEDMKDLHFLLSSSQGIALSKCYSFTTSPEPDWQVIARLIAVISSIFPDQAEFQFSDGRHTFYSKPHATEYGSYYFITIFAEGGLSISGNGKCLGRYIGFVVTVLFQQMISKCLARLEEKAILAIQNSTYLDTIQSDSVNGDGSFESTQSSLHDAFPEIMDCLGVFEEHFIRELLMSDEEIFYKWFQTVSDYLRHCSLIDDCSFLEVNGVYLLSPDDQLIPIMVRDVTGVCQCEKFSEDLMFGLTEYAHAVCSSPLCMGHLLQNEGWSCHPSNVMNIATNLSTSEDGHHFAPSVSSFFAVSHFIHVRGSYLLILFHYKLPYTNVPLLNHILFLAYCRVFRLS